VDSFKHIDTLVQGVFQRRVAIARMAAQANTRPRVARILLAGAGVAVAAALLLATGIPYLQQEPPAPTIATKPPAAPDLPRDIKKDTTVENTTDRTKPDVGTSSRPVVSPALDPIAPDAPDFAISDVGGIPTTLETYRGRAFLFGVVSRDLKTSVAGLKQIHEAFASNNAVRIVGVTRVREEGFDGTNFPVFFNHGSKLFGLADGEFLLLDATGTPKFKGVLSDTGNVAKLRSQLSQLNAR
jgi:hypothetical protein